MSSGERELAQPAAQGRWVRPSTPEDGPAIVALMRSAGLEPHADPAHLHWKYWQEWPEWPGSRSFVLTDGRDLLAHVAVVPGVVWCGGTRARVTHMIDWAARRDAAGAGVRLSRHVSSMSDLVLAVGGSRHTRRILPMLGYVERGSVSGYVRTLSPLAIPGAAIPSRWKLPPRMARSLFWSLTAPRGGRAGWRVRRVGVDEVEQIRVQWPAPVPGRVIFERSAARLRHALSCPIVPVELFTVEKAGRAGGYFVLSYAPAQARIADMWTASQEPADWRALVQAAVSQARRRRGLAELIAWSSEPHLAQILADCGFHRRLSLPIYLRAAAKAALPPDPMEIQMLDSDAFYLYFGGNELWA